MGSMHINDWKCIELDIGKESSIWPIPQALFYSILHYGEQVSMIIVIHSL